jgi:type VI secretion system protein ImpF
MSRIRPDKLLLPSVLDRLIDLDPDNRFESDNDRAQLLKDLKNSVRRDLENLLNTRVTFTDLPAGLPQLQTSLVNYGVPDFGTMIVDSSNSIEGLRSRIEDVIRRYETRFQEVRVDLDVDSKSRFSRSVRFVIHGVLHAEPEPEPVTFSSQLHKIASEFSVQAADNE